MKKLLIIIVLLPAAVIAQKKKLTVEQWKKQFVAKCMVAAQPNDADSTKLTFIRNWCNCTADRITTVLSPEDMQILFSDSLDQLADTTGMRIGMQMVEAVQYCSNGLQPDTTFRPQK